MRTFLRSSLVAGVILGLSDMTLNWIGGLERSIEYGVQVVEVRMRI